MKRNTVRVLLATACLLVGALQVHAWGRGGGVRVGGVSAGGYRGGSVGGFHTTTVGGYRGGQVGGYRAGTVGGYHAGGVGGVGGVGGYRAGTVGGVGGYRAGTVGGVGHVGMATDFGFAHAGRVTGGGYVRAGNFTRAYPSSVLAARGAAVRGGYYHYGAFNTGWWGAHPGAWRAAGWTAANAWAWSTWPALTNWFGWSAQPIYYDYGTTIVYQGDQVYINDQPGPPAAEYYQQAADLALSAPPTPPPTKEDDQWQPLGVFSLVQGEQSDTSAVFQLAVNKLGIIRGNYYNTLTDTTLPVRGSVDKKTQRASWIVGDQKNTVYDTGIYNLTKDESPVLIHFGKDKTQQWLLVRVQEKDTKPPEAEKEPTPVVGKGVATIVVVVPPEADVFFNGTPTSATGPRRQFLSPPLEPGYTYSYSIRARWTEDGRPVQQTRTVPLKAGANVVVDFTSPLP